MPQQSLADFVGDMEKADLLVRIGDEKRIDQLPRVMEDNPEKGCLSNACVTASSRSWPTPVRTMTSMAGHRGASEARSAKRWPRQRQRRIKPELSTTHLAEVIP